MTTRINRPTFNKAKNCERFSQELLAGEEITDISKDKQGTAIALSLPEEDESQIRENVLDQIAVDDLKSDDGFIVLLYFLGEHIARDDLTEHLEKTIGFWGF